VGELTLRKRDTLPARAQAPAKSWGAPGLLTDSDIQTCTYPGRLLKNSSREAPVFGNAAPCRRFGPV
jgi:hypothetical protein